MIKKNESSPFPSKVQGTQLYTISYTKTSHDCGYRSNYSGDDHTVGIPIVYQCIPSFILNRFTENSECTDSVEIIRKYRMC